MMMMMTQGSKANHTGNRFERRIEEVFIRNGFEVVTYEEFLLNRYEYELSGKHRHVLIKNAPYYRVSKKYLPASDFNPDNRDFTEFVAVIDGVYYRVECKYQDSRGTAAEKLSFVIDNCVDAGDGELMPNGNKYLFGYPEKNVILVLGGEVLESEWIDFMRHKAEEATERTDKNVYAFLPDEFEEWLKAV